MTTFFADTDKNSGKLLALYWAGYVLLFGFIQGFAANDIVTAFYNELFGLPVKVLFVWLVTVPLMKGLFFNPEIRFVFSCLCRFALCFCALAAVD